ncbi:MAG: tRNA epoxyqueuosine(34) reductase QueG [Pseudomonadota bacterium]
MRPDESLDHSREVGAHSAPSPYAVKQQLQNWATDLGFQQLDIANTELTQDEERLRQWLQNGLHADMDYMAAHGTKRTRAAELVEGTICVISARMNYLTQPNQSALKSLQRQNMGYVSQYALGRDYHKLLRKKLQKLASRLTDLIGPFGYRVFTDSAPVMERAFARKAGLGWTGKHTNILERHTGSWFFLGEIYTDLNLPINRHETKNYCGSCTACIDVCPTAAIVRPYVVDARRCISYQTIENKGTIPVELRNSIGNRIFGCDDCQLYCPWNRYAKLAVEPAFAPRENFRNADLLASFGWSEPEFLKKTEGSAIRRINHQQWLRNIAVAIGNAPANQKYINALKERLDTAAAILKEHIEWALNAQYKRLKDENK